MLMLTEHRHIEVREIEVEVLKPKSPPNILHFEVDLAEIERRVLLHLMRWGLKRDVRKREEVNKKLAEDLNREQAPRGGMPMFDAAHYFMGVKPQEEVAEVFKTKILKMRTGPPGTGKDQAVKSYHMKVIQGQETGRIYGRMPRGFNIQGTATGRVRSDIPNESAKPQSGDS